jgi:hypothetical protein
LNMSRTTSQEGIQHSSDRCKLAIKAGIP